MATIYGFHNLNDILSRRVVTVDPQVIYDAVAASARMYNDDLNRSLAMLVKPVQTHTLGVQPISENELQGVDQWGRPDPIRILPPAARFLPIYMAQTSVASNYVLSQKMTVAELQDRIQAMFVADTRWMRRQMLSALFNNVAYNFADPQFGTLSISTLANGDSEQYLRTPSGASSADTHHKGVTSIDNALFADMRAELVEHEENGGSDARIVAFVASADVAATKGLSQFVALSDPNLSVGAGVTQYTGNQPSDLPGTAFGYHTGGQIHLREWPTVPANYMVAVPVGGMKPLAMREDQEDSLRGFGEIPGREDQPYIQRIWSRRAGFGAYNRVGAAVYRTNNATYAVPAGFGAPQ